MNYIQNEMNTVDNADVFQDVVTRLRSDVLKVSDMKAEMLSGMARSLNNLKSSLERYENSREKTWQHYVAEKAGAK